MSPTISATEGVALVALRGELDIAERPAVAAVLREALDAGARDLLVDLSELTYLDCAGLSTLVRAALDAHAVGARLYVFRAKGQPQMLLAWAGRQCVSVAW